jgi:hypothetical protein
MLQRKSEKCFHFFGGRKNTGFKELLLEVEGLNFITHKGKEFCLLLIKENYLKI